jgi:hypothetical protein
MTITRAIGVSCNTIIRLIGASLALSKIHPYVLTFYRPADNIGAAVLMAMGRFAGRRW